MGVRALIFRNIGLRTNALVHRLAAAGAFLGGPRGDGRFLMSDIPLYGPPKSCLAAIAAFPPGIPGKIPVAFLKNDQICIV